LPALDEFELELLDELELELLDELGLELLAVFELELLDELKLEFELELYDELLDEFELESLDEFELELLDELELELPAEAGSVPSARSTASFTESGGLSSLGSPESVTAAAPTSPQAPSAAVYAFMRLSIAYSSVGSACTATVPAGHEGSVRLF
jgi:hypothetical protein